MSDEELLCPAEGCGHPLLVIGRAGPGDNTTVAVCMAPEEQAHAVTLMDGMVPAIEPMAARGFRAAALAWRRTRARMDLLTINLMVAWGVHVVTMRRDERGRVLVTCPECMHEHALVLPVGSDGGQRSYTCERCAGYVALSILGDCATAMVTR